MGGDGGGDRSGEGWGWGCGQGGLQRLLQGMLWNLLISYFQSTCSDQTILLNSDIHRNYYGWSSRNCLFPPMRYNGKENQIFTTPLMLQNASLGLRTFLLFYRKTLAMPLTSDFASFCFRLDANNQSLSLVRGIKPKLNYNTIRSTMCAKLFQSCLALYDPMDCSPPDSSVHGILQVRILERVAISSSQG